VLAVLLALMESVEPEAVQVRFAAQLMLKGAAKNPPETFVPLCWN
jgi:hypothetical protein